MVSRSERRSGPAQSGLNAVSCTSSTACTAVGEQVIPSIAAGPCCQLERGPVVHAAAARAATGRDVRRIVHSSHRVHRGRRGLARGADAGVRWTIARAPDPEQSNLYGVSCTASMCFAVGSWIDTSGWEAPLVESTIAPR